MRTRCSVHRSAPLERQFVDGIVVHVQCGGAARVARTHSSRPLDGRIGQLLAALGTQDSLCGRGRSSSPVRENHANVILIEGGCRDQFSALLFAEKE